MKINKPEINFEYPCQIRFNSVIELNQILLILDTYDIKWIEGQDPCEYITWKKKGWLSLVNKHKMKASIEKKYLIEYTLEDILKL